MTALWFYDYALTLEDEVANFHNDNGEGKNLTTYRSVMRGRRMECSVCQLPQFQWGALTNHISVFVVFLLVSVLYYQRHRPDSSLVQIHSTTISSVDACL